MNFFKRGLTSIFRRPGKTVILLVLIFILSNVIAGSISVKSALAGTQRAMLGSMGVEVTIEPDYEVIFSGDFDGTMPTVTSDIVEKIGKSEYVRSYDYSVNQWYECRGLKNYYEDSGGAYYEGDYNEYFSLKGGQSTSIKDIESGDLTLKEGRVYTKEEIESGALVLLLSDKLAERNGLTVGSKVVFLYSVYEPYNYSVYDKEISIEDGMVVEPYEPKLVKTLEFEYTVIGIFTANPVIVKDKDGNVTEQPSPLINTIYTDNGSINACNAKITEALTAAGHESTDMYLETTSSFTLTSPDVVEIFESQCKQYLPRGFKFTDNAKSFESIMTPMANVEWIADIVMWVAVGATVLIISLLVTLFLRDRKHEMGIYLALGERKGIIAAQILTEVLLIAVIAVSLSIFSGNVLAQKMSGTMLENQLAEQEKNNASSNSDINIGIYYPGMNETNEAVMSTEEVMELYSVSLDAKTILFIYLIGMGSVLISTMIPIIYTLRLKPKKILM